MRIEGPHGEPLRTVKIHLEPGDEPFVKLSLKGLRRFDGSPNRHQTIAFCGAAAPKPPPAEFDNSFYY